MNAAHNTNPAPKNFNKPAYIIFLMAAIYFLVVKDFSQAATFSALALVFDPFKTTVPFTQRPFYQRAWLFVHVVISIALFTLSFIGR